MITFSWPENSPDAIPEYIGYSLTLLRGCQESNDIEVIKTTIAEATK